MGYVTKADDIDKGWAWVVLSASAVILALLAAIYTAIGFFQVEFLETFQGSQGVVALTGSVYLSTLYACGPIAGIVCDLLTHRVAIMTGAALVSVAMVSASFCQDLFSLLFFYGFVCGAGAGLCYTPAVTVVSAYFFKYRTVANGICLAAPGVGILGAPYFLGWMIETYGWRSAMVYFGCCIAQICVLASLFFPLDPTPTPRCCCSTSKRRANRADSEEHVRSSLQNGSLKEEEKTERGEMVRSRSQLGMSSEFGSVIVSHHSLASQTEEIPTGRIGLRIKRLLFNKILWIMCLSQMLMIAGYSITLVLAPAFYQSAGLSLKEISLIYTTYGISVSASRILSGFVFNFMPHHLIKALFCLELGYAGTLALLPLFSSFPALLVCKFFVGMAYGPSYSLLAPILVRYLGLTDLSLAYGTVHLADSISSLVAPPIAGVLYDNIGNYGVCFFVAGSTIGASALTLILLSCIKNLQPVQESRAKEDRETAANQREKLISTSQKDPDHLSPEAAQESANDNPKIVLYKKNEEGLHELHRDRNG